MESGASVVIVGRVQLDRSLERRVSGVYEVWPNQGSVVLREE